MSIASELYKLVDTKARLKKAIEAVLNVNNITQKMSVWPQLLAELVKAPEEQEEELIQDEYTHIIFIPTSNTSVYSFRINTTGPTTVDWGDGSEVTTLTELGQQYVSHTYNTMSSANTTNKGINCIGYSAVEIKIYSESDYTIDGTGGTPSAAMNGTNVPGLNTVANTTITFIAAENCLLGEHGFAACQSLTRFKLSSRQTNLPKNLFYNAYGISKMVVPDTIITMDNAFNSNKSISEIVLPNSVTTLNNNALSGLSIKEVIIPDSVTSMGTSICANCKQLEHVVWKSPYKFIPSQAFSGCYNLKILDLSYATEQMYFGTSTGTVGTNSYITVVPGQTKIVVPTNLYNDWKKNAKWLYLKDYLYWRDQEGNLRNDSVLDEPVWGTANWDNFLWQ